MVSNNGRSEIFVKMVITSTTTDAEVEQAIALLGSVNCAIPLILQPATRGEKPSRYRWPSWTSGGARANRQLKDVRVLPQVHRLWGIP